MRILLLTTMLVLALAATNSLMAFDLTATTTITDADWPEIRDTLNAWRLTQFKPDGVTLQYPTLAALGESILRKNMRNIVMIQCAANLSICPAVVKSKMATQAAAVTGVSTALDQTFVAP